MTICLCPFAFLSSIYFSFLAFSFVSGKTEATAATKKVHFSVIVGDCREMRVGLIGIGAYCLLRTLHISGCVEKV